MKKSGSGEDGGMYGPPGGNNGHQPYLHSGGHDHG